MKNRREVCASFTVENENHEIKKVVVTQDLLSHYRKEENYFKKFRLESFDGPLVSQTEDPDIFQLANGTILKRKNR